MDREPQLSAEEVRGLLTTRAHTFLDGLAGLSEPMMPLTMARQLEDALGTSPVDILKGFQEARQMGLVRYSRGNTIVFTELGEEVATLPRYSDTDIRGGQEI
jgi:hypothetical protein